MTVYPIDQVEDPPLPQAFVSHRMLAVFADGDDPGDSPDKYSIPDLFVTFSASPRTTVYSGMPKAATLLIEDVTGVYDVDGDLRLKDHTGTISDVKGVKLLANGAAMLPFTWTATWSDPVFPPVEFPLAPSDTVDLSTLVFEQGS